MDLPLWILLLLAIVAPGLADIDMKFTSSPKSVIARSGANVTFECSVKVPAERIDWRVIVTDKDRHWLWYEVDRSYYDSVNNSTLSVINVPADSSRWYQCVVWYGAVILASVPAHLTIAKIQVPPETTKKTVLDVPATNDVALHCKTPKSDPPAVVSWWKEFEGTKKPVKSHHGVLLISNASIDRSGFYGCTAKNEVSGQEIDLPATYLQITHTGHSEARFLESENDIGHMKDGHINLYLQPNESLRLWCGAVGIPRPTVKWSWDVKRSSDGLNRKINGQHLVVSPFRAEDEGTYNCSFGSHYRVWRVKMNKDPYWEGVAKEVNVGEGKTARVSCGKPRGQPQPRVHWLLNSKHITDEVKINDSDLYIDKVEKSHAGIVQCFACNDYVCAFDVALLTVVPTQISDPGYASDSSMAEHSMQQPKRHNRKASKKRKPTLMPPSRPNVTRMSNDSVMVTWSTKNKGLAIQFFKVQHQDVTDKSNSTAWITSEEYIEPNIHSYLIDSLVPNKNYRFRIGAVYENQDNKMGKISNVFFLKQGGFDKPRAPTLTSVLPLSPTEIVISWTWDKGDSVDAAGFYVYYRAVTTAAQYGKVVARPTARHLHLSHLKPDTDYEFKVQAYTEQTPSSFSSILTNKTLGLPPPVPSATSPPPAAPAPPALLPAAGAAGGAVLVGAALITLLLCRRARRLPHKEKKSRTDNPSGNGYIPEKVPITITSNPMHNEGDNSVELSYMHNNNCGNATTDDGPPHSRKNTISSRNYV